MAAPARVDAPNGSRLRVRRCRVQKGVLWTSEAESLTESEHSRGGAVGCPAPKWRFHLLRLHTELPSSQLWELAFRTSSDPAGCAFVPAALRLVLVPGLIPAFSFHPSVNIWCLLSRVEARVVVHAGKVWKFHCFSLNIKQLSSKKRHDLCEIVIFSKSRCYRSGLGPAGSGACSHCSVHERVGHLGISF